ncbi:MAG: hypothetical protein MPJ50_01920 [Pirellulales bacterium]|nr:hypothetical protein [Pirellulales bacterium]
MRRTCDIINLRSWSHNDRSRRGQPCRHLGEEIGRRECQGCAGRVLVKQFACEHPKHQTTCLAACQTCEDYELDHPLERRRQRLLLRFPHGFGDAVQLTTVLRHLRLLVPQWEISVAVKPGMEALFVGLVSEIVPLLTPSTGYDIERRLAWHEPTECYVDSPATKAEKCLREVFEIRPCLPYCRYHVRPDSRARADATEFAKGLKERFPVHSGFVLIHYQGNSARRNKNIAEEVINGVCRRILKLNFTPVILDWDNRHGLTSVDQVGEGGIVCPGVSHSLWRGRGTGDAGAIAALAERAILCVGIDSGPGHVFAACSTPSIIVWTWHHPLHHFPPAEYVTHLVPENHARLLRGGASRDLGLQFFDKHYAHRCYRRLPLALERLVEEKLAPQDDRPTSAQSPSLSAVTNREGLRMHADLWVRHGIERDENEVMRDYVSGNTVWMNGITHRPRTVIDLAAGIGAFAASLHLRSRRTRVLCWNQDATAGHALTANVGDFAEIIPPGLNGELVMSRIFAWVHAHDRPLDMLRFDIHSKQSTKIAMRIIAEFRATPHCGLIDQRNAKPVNLGSG